MVNLTYELYTELTETSPTKKSFSVLNVELVVEIQYTLQIIFKLRDYLSYVDSYVERKALSLISPIS